MEKETYNATKNVMTVLIAGPECSGKTSLSQALAKAFGGFVIEEYAVDYLNEIDREYNYEDLAQIARRHFELYEQACTREGLIFLDSFLLNIKIWSNYRFNKVDPFITKKLKELSFDLVLLLEPDLPWEDAAYRENPDDRYVLFDSYMSEMHALDWSYFRISGEEHQRLVRAENLVEGHLALKKIKS